MSLWRRALQGAGEAWPVWIILFLVWEVAELATGGMSLTRWILRNVSWKVALAFWVWTAFHFGIRYLGIWTWMPLRK
ncbi:MAG TPA: hypothetical protein VIV15_07950 [Anaerolineales bacterium]